MSAVLLVGLLRDPETASALAPGRWNAIIAAARAERLLATLAHRLDGVTVPDAVARVLADARLDAERERRLALWEADRALAALAPLGIRVILLKGAAYAAAGLAAGQGRMIGDLDILVPRDRIAEAESALLAAGWEWVKPDPYDDLYYRRWMHELPPLIHRTRDRMIDVHHMILPLTARPRPRIASMIATAVALDGGAFTLRREDMVIHAAAHLFADGDLAGGLRNLWDIDRLCRQFGAERDDFLPGLSEAAATHGLHGAVSRALRLANRIFGTPLAACRAPVTTSFYPRKMDGIFARRLLARDGWGRDSRKLLGFAFYIRSHLLRMPLPLLLRHLWTKWRGGHRPI